MADKLSLSQQLNQLMIKALETHIAENSEKLHLEKDPEKLKELHMLQELAFKRLNNLWKSTTEGLPITQEPKYTIIGNHLAVRATGEVIPYDEPVFIFRAQDKKALVAIDRYITELQADYCGEEDEAAHFEAVVARRGHFQKFQDTNPDRVKRPDTAKPPAKSQDPDTYNF